MLTAILLVLSQLAAEGSAHVEGAPPAEPALARVRWGVGSAVVMGFRPHVLIPGGGLTAHLGIQLRDRYALYVQAQAATGLFTAYVSGALMAEISITRWFTVASGLGAAFWGHVVPTITFGGGGGGGGGQSTGRVSVGAPLRVAFPLAHNAAAHRHRFFIALDGFFGVNVTRDVGPGTYRAGELGEPHLTAGLSFGYQLM